MAPKSICEIKYIFSLYVKNRTNKVLTGTSETPGEVVESSLQVSAASSFMREEGTSAGLDEGGDSAQFMLSAEGSSLGVSVVEDGKTSLGCSWFFVVFSGCIGGGVIKGGGLMGCIAEDGVRWQAEDVQKPKGLRWPKDPAEDILDPVKHPSKESGEFLINMFKSMDSIDDAGVLDRALLRVRWAEALGLEILDPGTSKTVDLSDVAVEGGPPNSAWTFLWPLCMVAR